MPQENRANETTAEESASATGSGNDTTAHSDSENPGTPITVGGDGGSAAAPGTPVTVGGDGGQ